jgi:hypothetical protein
MQRPLELPRPCRLGLPLASSAGRGAGTCQCSGRRSGHRSAPRPLAAAWPGVPGVAAGGLLRWGQAWRRRPLARLARRLRPMVGSGKPLLAHGCPSNGFLNLRRQMFLPFEKIDTLNAYGGNGFMVITRLLLLLSAAIMACWYGAGRAAACQWWNPLPVCVACGRSSTVGTGLIELQVGFTGCRDRPRRAVGD